VEQAIIQQRALLDSYDPNRNIGLLLDEWGVWDRLQQDAKGRNLRASTLAVTVRVASSPSLKNAVVNCTGRSFSSRLEKNASSICCSIPPRESVQSAT
jgi:hypothetical protein